MPKLLKMDTNINTPKYKDLVQTATGLFWKHGIKKVSIEEICREANLSKMTFYRFFPNKIELAKTIINNLFDESVTKYKELMSQDISFEEKIKGQVLAKFEGTQNISHELIKDIYTDKKLGLLDNWEKRTAEFSKEVIKDFTHAQKMGWMRKDINLKFIMYFNSKMVEMTYDPHLVAMYKNTQDLIMEITNLFVYGIFPKSKETNE